MAIFWDSSKATYRDSKGKEIPYEQIRAAIDAVSDDTNARLLSLAELYLSKKSTFASWASESEALIRKSLIASGQIAAGGRAAMTNPLNGRLGSLVKFHLLAFRAFGLAVENEEVSDLEILSRVAMYAGAVVAVYEGMRKGVMVDAGFTECRNILGEANHCKQCPSLSAAGWMNASDMPPPGARSCLTRCRCHVEFR